MVSKKSRTVVREQKHRRLRNRFSGTAERPRLAVFRSNNHMYAQIIDDTVGKTLVSASTLDKEVKAELEKTNNVEAAAKALGASDDQTSVDLLLRFIDDADDDVVFAACESLRKVGSEHDTADLLARMQKIPEDRQTIREEIGKTVQELHHRP